MWDFSCAALEMNLKFKQRTFDCVMLESSEKCLVIPQLILETITMSQRKGSVPSVVNFFIMFFKGLNIHIAVCTSVY